MRNAHEGGARQGTPGFASEERACLDFMLMRTLSTQRVLSFFVSVEPNVPCQHGRGVWNLRCPMIYFSMKGYIENEVDCQIICPLLNLHEHNSSQPYSTGSISRWILHVTPLAHQPSYNIRYLPIHDFLYSSRTARAEKLLRDDELDNRFFVPASTLLERKARCCDFGLVVREYVYL